MVVIRNVVDDVFLHAVGTSRLVEEQLARATNLLVEAFESKGLPLSWNKACLITNDPPLTTNLIAKTRLEPEHVSKGGGT